MRSPPPLQIEERTDGNAVRMTLHGELDLATTNDLRDRLCRSSARGEAVHLDLSDLEFIDAAGAGLLIRAFAYSQRHGWGLQISPRVAPQVARVLELVGLKLPAV